jgi:hypothetical protein
VQKRGVLKARASILEYPNAVLIKEVKIPMQILKIL